MFSDRICSDCLLSGISKALAASYVKLDGPELRAFISRQLNVESMDGLAIAFGVREQFFQEAEDTCAIAKALLSHFELREHCETLFGPNWLERAQQPQVFKRQMRKSLRRIACSARRLYGAPDHRICVHARRDQELWQMKRMHPDWTFGQLALRCQVNRGTAERAYKRQEKREKQRLFDFQSVLRAVADEVDFVRHSDWGVVTCVCGERSPADHYNGIWRFLNRLPRPKVGLASNLRRPIAPAVPSLPSVIRSAPFGPITASAVFGDLPVFGKVAPDFDAITDADVEGVGRKLPPIGDNEVEIASVECPVLRRIWACAVALDAGAAELRRARYSRSIVKDARELQAQEAFREEVADLVRLIFRISVQDGANAWLQEGGLALRSGWKVTALPAVKPRELLRRMVGQSQSCLDTSGP